MGDNINQTIYGADKNNDANTLSYTVRVIAGEHIIAIRCGSHDLKSVRVACVLSKAMSRKI